MIKRKHPPLNPIRVLLIMEKRGIITRKEAIRLWKEECERVGKQRYRSKP